MRVIVQSQIDELKRKQLKIAAINNDIKVSNLLELFIDKFIEQPERILKVLRGN